MSLSRRWVGLVLTLAALIMLEGTWEGGSACSVQTPLPRPAVIGHP